MNRSRLAVYLLVALLFGALGVFLGERRWSPVPAEPNAVDLLFAQSFPDPQGTPQPLAQWKNRVIVLNFWATWCAPCVDEMPELDELHAHSAPSGTHVLGIGADSASNIAQFADKYKISYPLFVAGAGAAELARRFGNDAGGLPYTVVIDAQGKIRHTYLGRLKMDELKRDLAAL